MFTRPSQEIKVEKASRQVEFRTGSIMSNAAMGVNKALTRNSVNGLGN